MTQRLSVNINDATAAALTDLAEKRDTTVTEIVRRAVSVYQFVSGEFETGKRLQTVDREGHATTWELL